MSLSTIVFKTRQAIKYPKNKLPESPIKIDAGGKLNNKKPKQTQENKIKIKNQKTNNYANRY